MQWKNVESDLTVIKRRAECFADGHVNNQTPAESAAAPARINRNSAVDDD